MKTTPPPAAAETATAVPAEPVATQPPVTPSRRHRRLHRRSPSRPQRRHLHRRPHTRRSRRPRLRQLRRRHRRGQRRQHHRHPNRRRHPLNRLQRSGSAPRHPAVSRPQQRNRRQAAGAFVSRPVGRQRAGGLGPPSARRKLVGTASRTCSTASIRRSSVQCEGMGTVPARLPDESRKGPGQSRTAARHPWGPRRGSKASGRGAGGRSWSARRRRARPGASPALTMDNGG